MRRTTAAIGIGAVGAAVWGLTRAFRRAHHHVELAMEQSTAVPADVIISRVADVACEPELIPFVESVEVLNQTLNSADYIVHGRTLGIPWWMHYIKTWDYGSNSASWRSVDGSYGIENAGRIRVFGGREGNTIKLTSGYSVSMPKWSANIERIMKPFVAYAFGVWLRRFSR